MVETDYNTLENPHEYISTVNSILSSSNHSLKSKIDFLKKCCRDIQNYEQHKNIKNAGIILFLEKILCKLVENIDTFAITDEKCKQELFQLILESIPTITYCHISLERLYSDLYPCLLENIDKFFSVADKKNGYELATLYWKKEPTGYYYGFGNLAKNLHKFDIRDEKLRAQLAIDYLQSYPNKYHYIFENLDNFAITDDKLKYEIMKLILEKNSQREYRLLEDIQKLDITDEKLRYELALLFLQKYPKELIKNFDAFSITNQDFRYELAKKLCKINNYFIIKNIKIIKSLYESNGENTRSIFDLGAENFLIYPCFMHPNMHRIQKLQYPKGPLHEEWNHQRNVLPKLEANLEKNLINFYKVIYKDLERLTYSSFKKRISDIQIKISQMDNKEEVKILESRKNKELFFFKLLENLYKDSPLSEKEQNYFITILNYRNRETSSLLSQIFAQNYSNSKFYARYQDLICKSKKPIQHLILPMILITLWDINSKNPLQDKIKDILSSPINRKSLRDAKGFLPNLLQTSIELHHNKAISSEQKLQLLYQSLASAQDSFQCKMHLNILSTLMTIPIAPFLTSLSMDYDFKEVIAYFNQRLQCDIFAFDPPIENFAEKYILIEEEIRMPTALVQYSTNLKQSYDISAINEGNRLMRAIFERNLQKTRYQTHNNPHLQKIEREFPEIFAAWQVSPTIKPLSIRNTRNQSVNFFQFLKQKILIDKHFHKAPKMLLEYFNDPEKVYSLDNLEADQRKIFIFCKELCDPLYDFHKKKCILTELLNILPSDIEFTNDIKSLLEGFSYSLKQEDLFVMDTDDWQDLFLCGTEILGSCQRIDGNSSLNKCLPAYALDGKNRLLAIKSAKTGKIMARCILRLLWDSSCNKPALFQERIYPANCAKNSQHELNILAKTRAQGLQIDLYTCNIRGKFKSRPLTSLGGPCPYEYVDAEGQGIKNKGQFTITTATMVT